MNKIDFKKEWKHLYRPSSKKVSVVDITTMNFLKIDGTGNPNTAPQFQEAVEALFSVAYNLKFSVKKREVNPIDYVVPPLEGLWWMDDMREFSIENKDQWKWTVMIMQPEYITPELFQASVETVGRKKELPALAKMRFEAYNEGKAAQIMHIGPFSAEGSTIEKLHQFIKDSGHRIRGLHHEIYLSDFRRVAPEKMKTIIRQPFK